jgi:RNA polymerase sigma-70 factor (ECF subfamily)
MRAGGTVVQPQVRSNEDWLQDLRATGPSRDAAIEELREYLLRAILVYLTRQRSDLGGLDYDELQQLAEDWAQTALLQILDKLDSFRGDSKFTTWAYRVAVNLAAADLRRKAWNNLSVEKLTADRSPALATAEDQTAESPETATTRAQVWEAIQKVIDEELTERQRTALTRAVLDGVPMEIVADELNTNRNNIYKIIHDARRKLRRELERREWSQEDVLAAFAGEPTE